MSAFNDLNFVFLAACKTAEGGGDADNFANAIYNKGANTVLAFKNNIDVDEVNAWSEYFMIEFSKGITLEEALIAADNRFKEILKSEPLTVNENNRVILGSDQIRMFD